MNTKNLMIVGLLFCSASGMKKSFVESSIPAWHISADDDTPCPRRVEHLAQVLPALQVGLEGRVETLIARPMSGWRQKRDSLILTKSGVKGDRRNVSGQINSELQAVSLMRSDVSEALGGAPVLGDDIHVSGLDLGEKSLACGGLIVIKDAEARIIKAVLLKTAIEYYANEKIFNRCGALAANFLNAEGRYERSAEYGASPVHGLRDRLRGLKLVVLVEGEVSQGDRVFICNSDESASILKEHGLEKKYQQLIERSVVVANSIQQRHVDGKFERYMVSWRANHACCGGLGVKGVAALSSVMALLVLGSKYLG